MGLLDSLVGAIGGGSSGGGQGAQLVGALLQQLGGQQGLGALVEQFSRGGLGDVVQSWVGTGQNLPISPDQIAQVLGSGPLAQLAQQFGVQPAQMASQLSSRLPGLVDQLTPQGQLPEQGLDELLGSLSGMLKG